MKKREKYDYWGVPFSELYPILTSLPKSAPYEVDCDCGKRARCIKAYRLYRCSNCQREYTCHFGEYVLIQKNSKGEQKND